MIGALRVNIVFALDLCNNVIKRFWYPADYPELDIARYSDDVEATYTANQNPDKFKKCFLWLDFRQADMTTIVNGQVYMLTLTAYNEYSDVTMEKTVSLEIKTWTYPEAGSLTVRFAIPRKKVLSSMHKMSRLASFCACIRFHLGLCSIDILYNIPLWKHAYSNI